MSDRLCIVRPTGYNLEAADMGTWLFHFGFTLGRHTPELQEIFNFNINNHRVPMCRNKCATWALQHKATHILWCDPDMAIDRYVKWGPNGIPIDGTRAFWLEAWPFIKAHPGSIVSAPYRGGAPGEPVHVFVRNRQGHLVRVSHETAQAQRGWTSVEAIGAGLMLMDSSIFQRLEPPFFKDTFTNQYEDELRHSSDVQFSLRCRAAGIPIYVCWDTWAGHWQNRCVEKAGFRPQPPPPVVELLSPDPSIPVLQEQDSVGGNRGV